MGILIHQHWHPFLGLVDCFFGKCTFPIFQGFARVDGNDIPAGVPIYAKLGDHRSLIAETQSGTYMNVVIGAKKNSDYGKFITFHIGSPDTKSVQAKEKYKMLESDTPISIKFDLNFPELP